MMPCEVKSNVDLKVMLPGTIIVDKKSKDVLEDLDSRKEELKKAREKLVKAYRNTASVLNKIKAALQKMTASENNSKAPTNVN
jgi:chaperonin cofactor prefoldin